VDPDRQGQCERGAGLAFPRVRLADPKKKSSNQLIQPGRSNICDQCDDMNVPKFQPLGLRLCLANGAALFGFVIQLRRVPILTNQLSTLG
jgi:hypothetical protein